MKIKDLRNKGKPSYGKILEVYGIYWLNTQRMYFTIPYEDYEGFLVMNEMETEIVDNQLKEVFVMREDVTEGDLLLHWAADKDDLIYDLLEHEPEAMKEFRKRLQQR